MPLKLGPIVISWGKADEVSRRTSVDQVPAPVTSSAGTAPFGPGSPMPPAFPAEGRPRQFQYPVGYNFTTRPRASEPISFATLRSLADIYDVGRICIETRKKQLRGLDWTIVAKEEGQGHKYADEIKRVRAFFEKPDREHPFDQWLNALAEDRFVIDALTLYKRRTRGGELYALEPVDGATIKPLLDAYGRRPEPPAKAYQQFIYGVPFADFTADELIYRPENVRTHTPYGLAPLESLLLTINTDIKLQWNFLMYFTEGNIPQGFGSTPEGWTPQQILEFEELWNAVMSGQQSMKHRVRFVPAGFNFERWQEPKFDVDFPVFLLKKTCAALDVQPQEIGWTEDVNRATGEVQENISQRRALGPLCQYLAGIINDIIATDLRAPYLEFRWLGVDLKEDALKQAQVDEIYIRSAVVSPDEIREDRLGKKPDEQNRVGRLFMTVSGPVFLEEALAMGEDGPAVPAVDVSADEELDAADLRQELKRWEKMATRRASEGKPLRRFESDLIPDEIRGRVEDGLVKAETSADIKKVFAEVMSDVPAWC